MAAVVLIAAQPGFSQSITGSAHDFSNATWNRSVGKQICIVCHTPHNAPTTATDAPFWNHATTATVFTLYTSNTLNATVSQPDGSSKLCLSCHDGTVAIENFGSTTNGSTLMTGSSNFGTSLSNEHPISFTYDAALATEDGDLENPATGNSGLGGTIAAKMLSGGKMQCSSCHDVHNSAGLPRLLVKSNSTLCQTCHTI
jgi:predicted CXXCH cytochrome family protein